MSVLSRNKGATLADNNNTMLKAYFNEQGRKAKAYYQDGDFTDQLSKNLLTSINPVKDFYNGIDEVALRLSSQLYTVDPKEVDQRIIAASDTYKRTVDKVMEDLKKDIEDSLRNGIITSVAYDNLIAYAYSTWSSALKLMPTKAAAAGNKLINSMINNRLTQTSNMEIAQQIGSMQQQLSQMQNPNAVNLNNIMVAEPATESMPIDTRPTVTYSNRPEEYESYNYDTSAHNPRAPMTQILEGEINAFTHGQDAIKRNEEADHHDHQYAKERAMSETIRKYQETLRGAHETFGLTPEQYSKYHVSMMQYVEYMLTEGKSSAEFVNAIDRAIGDKFPKSFNKAKFIDAYGDLYQHAVSEMKRQITNQYNAATDKNALIKDVEDAAMKEHDRIHNKGEGAEPVSNTITGTQRKYLDDDEEEDVNNNPDELLANNFALQTSKMANPAVKELLEQLQSGKIPTIPTNKLNTGFQQVDAAYMLLNKTLGQGRILTDAELSLLRSLPSVSVLRTELKNSQDAANLLSGKNKNTFSNKLVTVETKIGALEALLKSPDRKDVRVLKEMLDDSLEPSSKIYETFKRRVGQAPAAVGAGRSVRRGPAYAPNGIEQEEAYARQLSRQMYRTPIAVAAMTTAIPTPIASYFVS